MAELHPSASVPARWRFLFAAALPLLFFAAMLHLLWPVPDAERKPSSAEQEQPNARLRLQAAAVAFSTRKLDPDIAIVTDRPEIYAPPRPQAPASDAAALKFWAKMKNDHKIEFDSNAVLPREFQPFFNIPVLVDLRDSGAWNVFTHPKRSPERFDMILLDCAFPDGVFSPETDLWTTWTFSRLARFRMRPGAVFAVALPQARPSAAACILTAMNSLFGNAGTFCFGERVIAASSVSNSAAEPEKLKDLFRFFPRKAEEIEPPDYSLDDINETASVAGYYSMGAYGMPEDALSVVLQRDYSGVPPARLLEDSYELRGLLGQHIGPLAYSKAEFLPRLRKHLPDGLPYGTLCVWALGIATAVYLLLRYFISWKPVHKQAFLAFEDMFCLTGCFALFCMALLDTALPLKPRLIAPFLFLLLGFCFLLDFRGKTKSASKRRRIRVVLAGCVFFALAFCLAPSELTTTLFFIAACFLGDTVEERFMLPVQPGPAIPLAFIIGIVASLAMFAVSLCFPFGPVVFAAVVCVYRLILPD
jgi:hypothetical protein